MKEIRNLLGFSVDKYQFAFDISQVERVIQAVEITNIPETSTRILGLVEYQGTMVPVISFRRRLGLAEIEQRANDYFILVNTLKRSYFIIATDVSGVVDIPETEISGPFDLQAGSGMSGVFKREDGLYFIYDLSSFLTSEDEAELESLINDNGNKTLS